MHGSRRTRLAVAGGLGGLALVAGLMAGNAVLSPALDDSTGPADRATRAAVGTETRDYPDVATLAASSDLVVKATVRSVERGRTVGPDDAPITFREVHLDVDDVVYQRPGRAAPSSLAVEEEGWTADGVGFTMNGVAWSQAGDTGYYFLHLKSDGQQHYRLTSSYGRALVTSTGVSLSGENGHGDGPWGPTDVSRRGIKDLETDIHNAAAKARSGAARPATPAR